VKITGGKFLFLKLLNSQTAWSDISPFLSTQKNMTMTTTQAAHSGPYQDWRDLERVWRKQLVRFSDRELLEMFPDCETVLSSQLHTWETKKDQIIQLIKSELASARRAISDDFSYWFVREWTKVNYGEGLLEAEKHLARLRRLISAIRGSPAPMGRITEDQIQQARQVPIENFCDRALKKCGRGLVGICPFHTEETPSFHVYTEDNHFWCFGCNRGGDAITYVQLIHGYSFPEAVRSLLGESQ